MKYLNQEIENELMNRGAELIRFVDISHLSEIQNRQLPNAFVFALPLAAGYIKEVCDIPDYVQARIDDNYNFADDEYLITKTGLMNWPITWQRILQKRIQRFFAIGCKPYCRGKI